MHFEPTTEQKLLIESVRAFVEQELYPHEQEVERTGQVRSELVAQIRDKAIAQGFYAANMPEALGGGGQSLRILCGQELTEQQHHPAA